LHSFVITCAVIATCPCYPHPDSRYFIMKHSHYQHLYTEATNPPVFNAFVPLGT